jgi:hydroxymethylpyrimidine/phosphomethylpyrimidine kinase
MSVITALTAQNTQGVAAIHDVPSDFVLAQLEAVFEDIRVDGVKVGMLSRPGILETVAAFLETHHVPVLVVDPVMVSKSGHALLQPEAVALLVRRLLPLAGLVTPNIPEAEALTGLTIRTLADMEAAGRRLVGMGARAVLVKGGHRAEGATDVLVTAEGVTTFPGERLDAKHTHGTGCSLSSACAALWARTGDLEASIRQAKAYVATGIRHGLAVGRGIGPIHHFYDLYEKAGINE